ncbi:MAG: DUF11 domain-containing protein, partial [Phycisphaerae bacterium]|nr:DUF11 domain-containing protein [Phycisphaerae bacterium]
MTRFHGDSALARRTLLIALLGLMTLAPAQAQQSLRLAKTQMAYPTGDPRTSILLLERTWPAEVRAGTTFEYELKLSNLTDAPIHGITLTEQMPTGLTITAINPQAQRADGAVGSWYWETLGAHANSTIRIQATAGRTGEASACASITLQSQACASMLVVQPALQLVKNAPAEVIICDPIPVTVTVTNTGSGVARNVHIVDTLPNGWTTADGQREVTVNIGDLAAGQAREVAFQAHATQTGDYTNTAMATEDGGLRAQDSTRTRITRPVLTLGKTGPNVRFLGRPAT